MTNCEAKAFIEEHIMWGEYAIGEYGKALKKAIKALEHEQALKKAFNIAVLYGKEKGMEAIDKALYQMGMDGIKEQGVENG